MRLGFITPLTNNFCDGCNRVRVAATGTVFGCLGHDQKVELRDLLAAAAAKPSTAPWTDCSPASPRGTSSASKPHGPRLNGT